MQTTTGTNRFQYTQLTLFGVWAFLVDKAINFISIKRDCANETAQNNN